MRRRALYTIMGLYLGASAIELADQSGLAGEESAVATTAEMLREMRSGDDPLGLVDGVEEVVETVRKVASAFEDIGRALE